MSTLAVLATVYIGGFAALVWLMAREDARW